MTALCHFFLDRTLTPADYWGYRYPAVSSAIVALGRCRLLGISTKIAMDANRSANSEGCEEIDNPKSTETIADDAFWSEQSQGYTPLLHQNSACHFSTGISGATFSSRPGHLLGSSASHNDDMDNYWSEEGLCGDVASGAFPSDTVSSRPSEDSLEDAHAHLSVSHQHLGIADSALMALEADYERTITCRTAFDAQVQLLNGPSGARLDDSTIKNDDSTMVGKESPKCEQDSPSYEFEFLPDFGPLSNRIDSNAVLRAMSKIKSQNTDLDARYTEWSGEQVTVVPYVHPLIPCQPLRAFRTKSKKARQATAVLSRSATLADAVLKLDLLRSSIACFKIHIIGCDFNECNEPGRLFKPFVRWIGADAECPKSLELRLIGPDVPNSLASLDLLSSSRTRLESATIHFHTMMYDDWNVDRPHLIIVFNAGLWGYESWRHCLAPLTSSRLPFVCTAYTLQESEDDFEVLQELQCTRCVWEPTMNRFGSLTERQTFTAPSGRRYRENAAWQGWLL